jgi:hypothetical protein
MTMQVWPSQASNIAVWVWTIVTQQKHSILKNIYIFVLDAKIAILLGEIGLYEVLKSL